MWAPCELECPLGLSVPCLVFFVASCCGSSEMSHAIPRHVFQTLKSHRWNCNVLGCCTKFGYPNCVRVLVDEAPEASSCVRSSSHDTVHNPRDASTTTPTPQNAKSRFCGPGVLRVVGCYWWCCVLVPKCSPLRLKWVFLAVFGRGGLRFEHIGVLAALRCLPCGPEVTVGSGAPSLADRVCASG